MKALKRILGAAALALGLCGNAAAELIKDTYTPLFVYITAGSPFTYTHDMRPQGLPGAAINWAKLDIYLYDITDPLSIFPETVTLRFDGGLPETETNIAFAGQNYHYDIGTSLLDDGLLSFTINVGCYLNGRRGCLLSQDVVFARSELSVDITRAAVPEPATLLTLGAGLLGLAGARRRRRAR
ncbi:PEP-CTERM sorting domain-containing protein [Massilia yuzhufengensis]|uniref:PEP-CTERM protein-sorting domain-containing protein n=1 Tax=Massilia yuzhufengensis TaxID=1164594 RepID=A0A1I1RHY7_9BURK|nr:PEP-CTERM sorting domain-containing protein [Massilia yuzhufengensis]SFD33906.1 PEP-CTERM protein-sorting domain-containing protein [Massilia yuzhufengensis]